MKSAFTGKFLRIIVFLILLSSSVSAQTPASSESDLKKQADRYFNDEDYDDALIPYSQLLSLYPQNNVYNYRYGVCLIIAGKEKTNAVLFLQKASADATMPEDVWYYLAKAYLIVGKFSDAESALTTFNSKASPSKQKKLDSATLLANCRVAVETQKNRKNVVFLENKIVARNDFSHSFDWSLANGRYIPAAEQFLSGADKDNLQDASMFITNDKQTIYISSYGKNSLGGKDIYIIRKQPNGQWSTPENLGAPVNTAADEDFPYLDRDGKTLYFSAKNENSIGGYDVFKSVIDFNTGKWSSPENMGWPINTIGDDYLFVPVSKGKEAFYATTVEAGKKEISIRKIQLPDAVSDLVTINGLYFPLDQRVRRDARISILRGDGKGLITTVYTDPQNGHYEVDLEPGKDYMIVVEGGGYVPHAESFSVPSGLNNPDLRQVVKLNRSKDNESMTLENYFYPVDLASTQTPSQTISADYTPTDSSSTMVVNINNSEVRVTKPGTGRKETTLAENSESNDSTNENAKDNFDPTLEKNMSPDDVRQKEEESKRKAELVEDEKSPKYDITISNEELATIAENDAKVARAEADSLKKEVERLSSAASERESLADSYTAKALKADEGDKMVYQNKAYELKTEAEDLRRQSADMQLAASAKEAEAASSEQDAIALKSSVESSSLASNTKKGKGGKSATGNKSGKPSTRFGETGNTESTPASVQQSTEPVVSENTNTRNVTAGVETTGGENTTSPSATNNNSDQSNSSTTAEQTEPATTVGVESVKGTETKNVSGTGKENDALASSPTNEKNVNSGVSAENPATTTSENKSSSTSSNENNADVAGEKQKTGNADNSLAVNTPSGEKTNSENIQGKTNENQSEVGVPGNTQEGKVTSGNSTKGNDQSNQSELPSTISNSTEKTNKQSATAEQSATLTDDRKSANDASRTETTQNNEVPAATTESNAQNSGTGKAESTPSTQAAGENNTAGKPNSTGLGVTIQSGPESTSSDAPLASDSKNSDQQINREINTPTTGKETSSEQVNGETASAPAPSTKPSGNVQSGLENPAAQASSTQPAKSQSDQSNKSSEKFANGNKPSTTSGKPSGESNLSGSKPNQNSVNESQVSNSDMATSTPQNQNANDVKTASGSDKSTTRNTELALNTATEKNQADNAADNTAVSTSDSASAENYQSTAELKKYDLPPLNEEQKPLPADINSRSMLPVKEEARLAFQEYKRKLSNSKKLANQAIELENRISVMKASPERDSLIYVANDLNSQSSDVYRQSMEQLEAAKQIDPEVAEKMEQNEQIIAYNSSVSQNQNGKNAVRNSVPENSKEGSGEVATDATNPSAGAANATQPAEKDETMAMNAAPVKSAPEEAAPVVIAPPLSEAEAKEVEEMTNFAVETPNGTEQIKISTEGLDTRNPEFKNYVELNKKITNKQVETINVFAEAVNLNKKAVEEKQEQGRLMDSAEMEQDIQKKAKIFVQADSMKALAEADAKLSEEKFRIAQSKTGDVKSVTAQMEEVKSRITLPGAKTAARSTASVVRPQEKTKVDETYADAVNSKPEELPQVNSVPAEGSNVRTTTNIANLGQSTSTEENNVASTQQNQVTENDITSVTGSNGPVKGSVTVTVTEEEKQTFATQSFSIADKPVYSDANPIPMNPELPEGLVFKVQIGAFHKPIPSESFKGVQPISGETTRPGWVRYCVGLFKTFEPAGVVKKEMQSRGFKDAFVVAYYNGKRIELSQAYAMLAKDGKGLDNAYVSTSRKEMALLRANNIRPENNAEVRRGTIGEDEKAFYGDNASREMKSVAAVEYAVQVGVYRSETAPVAIRPLMPLFTEKIKNNLYRFTTDHFIDYATADSMKRVARAKGVKDAFIVVYRNGAMSNLASVPVSERRKTTANSVSVLTNANSSSALDQSSNDVAVSTAPSASREGLVYRVQLGAFRNNIPFSSVVAFLQVADKGITQQTDDRGLHIFYAGEFTDYESAVALRAEIVAKGITDAFVVTLKDGKRIK